VNLHLRATQHNAAIEPSGETDRRPLSLPRRTAGSGRTTGRTRPSGAAGLLERDRVHRLRDLVNNQVGELRPLAAVQSS